MKTNYKPLFIYLNLLVFFSLLLTSCTNELGQAGKDLVFSIDKQTIDSISRSLKDNKEIRDDSSFNIECILLKDNKVIQKQNKLSSLKDIHTLNFNLANIPFGADYFISLKMYYNSISIYEAISNAIDIKADNNNVSISLNLKPNKFQINYILNNDSSNPDAYEKTKYFFGSEITLLSPLRENYNFDGWYLTKDFTSEKLTKLERGNFLGNVTLYAKWIKFDKVSKVIFSPAQDNKVNCGDKIKLESQTPNSVIHYALKGEVPTNTSPVYDSANQITITEDMIGINNEIEIKAFTIKEGMEPSDISSVKYERKIYKVTYNKNGHGADVNPKTEYKKNEKVELPQLSENGFNFEGWYKDNEKISNSFSVTEDFTLTAQWTKWGKVSNVNFTPTQNNKVNCGDKIKLESSTPNSVIHYALKGEVPTNTSPVYDSANQITITEDMIGINNEIEIKAFAIKEGMEPSDISSVKYERKIYKVTYNKNGHGADVNPKTEYKKNEKVELPQLSENGFNFEGWYKDNEKISNSFTVTESFTLTAQWKAWDKVEKVTFSSRDGEIDYKDKIKLSCNTEDAVIHYTLEDNDTYNILQSPFEIELENDKTIKAYATKNGMTDSDKTLLNCKIKKYTVSFRNNTHGSTPSSINNLKKDDKLTAEHLEMTPTNNSGYKFEKWTDAKNNEIKAGHSITENLVLQAIWTNIAPGKVTDVKASFVGGSILFEWTNPADLDLQKIVISSDTKNEKLKGFSSIEIKDNVKPGQKMTYRVRNIENGSDYSFSIKAVDKGNKNSEEYKITPTLITEFTPTDTPIIVRTTKINNKTYDIVEFGDWPQSLYKGDKLLLKECEKPLNSWDKSDCYTDEKGSYFIKVEATPHDTAKKYYTSGETYYFKIEPIEWRILTNNYQEPDGKNGYKQTNKKLLLSEQALASIQFSEKGIQKYDNSNIRQYLNGNTGTKYDNKGFLQLAFSTTARSKITETLVDNSVNSIFGIEQQKKEFKNLCENTKDKIFLLSKKEATTIEYGFKSSIFDADYNKRKLSTDYAIATGIKRNEEASSWWLRSPSPDFSMSISYVSRWNFALNSAMSQAEKGEGVVPALTIE